MMKHIFQANLLGLPALTIPVPRQDSDSESTEDSKTSHLPIGFQLLGDHWSEAKLLSIAKELQQSAVCEHKSPDYFDALA